MKSYKNGSDESLVQIVFPFGPANEGEEFFDDCPHCQALKKQLERGEWERVEEGAEGPEGPFESHDK